MSTPRISGRCLCGAITYRAVGEPVMTALCHCDDCQRTSGAAFSVNVVVESDGFEVAGDTLATDTGERRERQFCSRRGSTLFTRMAETPDMVVIKAGTLDDRSWVEPEMELWRESAQSWCAKSEELGSFPRGIPT